MIDTHHVGAILTIANFEYTHLLAIEIHGLVADTNRGLYVFVGKCFVGGLSRKVALVDSGDALAPFLIKIYANDDITVPFDRRIGDRKNIAQEVMDTFFAVWAPAELHGR